jgi:hypothetical protein
LSDRKHFAHAHRYRRRDNIGRQSGATSNHLVAFRRRLDSVVFAAVPRGWPEGNTMMSSAPSVFTLGHSIDPDDAFMFYAMAKNKIDLRGYRFEHQIEAIQILNERALRGELHISAISIHALAYVSDRYALLPCGQAWATGMVRW